MRFSAKYAIISEPYMYIVMNLENFARGVDRLDQYTYGYFTADSIIALSGLKHWIADYFSLVERPFLISGFNTFPFLWTYYRDFGLIGMTICCFILGLSISFLYFKFRTQPNPVLLILYAISVFFVVLSFFTNILSLLTVVFNILVLIIVHSFFLQKKILPNRISRTRIDL
jgi:oligosaccharide repeat unit polymerase